MIRTHSAGTLRATDAESVVILAGWVSRRRDHGGVAFIDLRDSSGVVQVVIHETDLVHDLRAEWCLKVVGKVSLRPAGNENPELPTGAIEVLVTEIEVLSESAALPFPIDGGVAGNIGEEVRLRYRYLDLRREGPAKALRLRSKVTHVIREVMESRDFLEIETPNLTRSTPEGARDFLVPVRLQPGSWYALPQSPQLFKQLLMVAGMERYYQIARCLRDEDLRADRQYEFMQLDAEMSFVSQDDVLENIGRAVVAAAIAVTGEAPPEIERITWHDAMNRFGIDKPDLRFAMELIELTSLFASTEFKAFAGASCIKGICVDAKTYPEAAAFGRNKLDGLTDRAKKIGAKGLVWMKIGADGAVDSPVAKFLSDSEKSALVSAMGATEGDLLLLVADEWDTTCEVLGQLRNDIGRPPVHQGPYKYVWVTEFPLFIGIDPVSGRPRPGHHPFCQPHPDDMSLFETEPLKVRALAYDLVLNGWELGSGSIRIHEPEMQRRVFNQLGISDEEADKRFGFFLQPFKYGAPPHGGFAFGIDRLAAILAGEENIREVIAFPKTQSGSDPMTNAPTPVDPAHLAELGLRLLPPPASS